MASITTISRPSFSAPPLRLSSSFPLNPCHKIVYVPPRHTKLVTLAMEGDNDWGARDPFPAEIASNFGDKVLGFGSTEHKILIPNLAALSLSRLECSPKPFALSEQDAQNLLRKVQSLPYPYQCFFKILCFLVCCCVNLGYGLCWCS